MSISAVFAIADASATKRGAVNVLAQTFAGTKTFQDGIVGNLTGQPSALLGHNLSGTPSNGQVLGFNGTSWVPTTASAGLQGEVNVRDFGAVGDGVTDDWAAFKAAHDSFPNGVGSGSGSRGGILNIPRGVYYLSRTWEITKKLVIKGAGMGFQAGSVGTYLRFAAGQTGIRLYSSEPASPDGNSAGYTSIQDIQVGALGKTTTAHGIYASCQVYIDRVIVGDMASDGFLIKANSAVDGSGNANGSVIRNCLSLSNSGDGFHVQGSDANTILIANCEGSNNDGWQFNNESWLSNTISNCGAENGTGKGTYRSTASGSIFRDCYLEYSAHAQTDIAGNCFIECCNFGTENNGPWISITDSAGPGSGAEAVVVSNGGVISSVIITRRGSGYVTPVATFTHTNGINGAVTVHQSGGMVTSVTVDVAGSGYEAGYRGNPGFMGQGDGQMRTATSINFMQRSQGITRAVDLWVGGYSTNGAALLSGSVADVMYAGEPDRTDILAWNNSAKCFESQFNHSSNYSGIRYIHPLSTTETGGRGSTLPPGSIEFPQGFWVGDGANARFVGNGSAAPVSGTWAQGDVVYNIAPVAGGFVGWVCTAGGTPGTWKTFGAISA